MEFDTIIEDQGNAGQQNDFNLEAWAAQKKEERERLFADVDRMADAALTDPRVLQAYLAAQGRFPFGVTNTLLVMAQRLGATHVRTAEDWKKLGRGIQNGEGHNAILLFKADHEYAREDGTIGTGYNVKRFFDISQTYGKPVPPRQQIEMKPLLSALTKNAPVQIRLSDEIQRTIGAAYQPETKQLLVARGLAGGIMFLHIAREFANADLGEGQSFIAACAANIVCGRYGIVPSTFGEIPRHISGMDAKDKRGVLESVRQTAGEIISRMEQNLEPHREMLREQARQNAGRENARPELRR